jgi:hypothetical protein
MKRLSSQMTPVSKFVLPGIFILTAPIWYVLAFKEKFGFIPAVMWTGFCVYLFWWSASIKGVELKGEVFTISNYRRSILVPTSHLVRITEDRFNRTPSICLYFDPPCEFGRKIRIIPPLDFMSRRSFDAVARTLYEIIHTKKK